ncbi:MAG: enoyl-CoA hydratase/isomerase family protein [bacterium]|nr:enoyl-CoA hydratase/isomerase family protein [bacterium]
MSAQGALELNADNVPAEPCIVVDLDDSAALDEIGRLHSSGTTAVVFGTSLRPLSDEALRAASRLTCTVVPEGLASAPSLIGVADPDAAIGQLRAAIDHSPIAAASLARLLPQVTDLPVIDGLAAESAVYSMLLAGREFAGWLADRPAPRSAAKASGEAVRMDRRGNVLEITLDRPARRNAFDMDIRDGLAEAFDLVADDSSITRVDLRGEGPAFCSGGDLDEFGLGADVTTMHLIRLDRSIAARVNRSRDRVVAHLHGACVGAGIEVPSFAGRVFAAPGTWFHLPEVAMGLVPGAGGTVGITRRVGRWRTAYLAISGVRLDLTTALDWGLVDAIE